MTFAWRRTFPDTHHDFIAEEDGEGVGRIYRTTTGGVGPQRIVWVWSATGVRRCRSEEGIRPLEGEVDTRDEAIEALTAAWRRAKAWSARTGRAVG